MCTDGGQLSDRALECLLAAQFSGVVKMEGGYTGWGAVSIPAASFLHAHVSQLSSFTHPPPPAQIWSPSGKRRPPPGRWVSSGKEALKSGLNIPGVAESYDEGGNLKTSRYARGLGEGEDLPKTT
jgi:hypothetical protein